jgi:hypothetical protein
MHEQARARVKLYIADVHRSSPLLLSCSHAHTSRFRLQEVPKQLRAQTHEAVRSRFPELYLSPFGVEVTDGYRPPVGRAFPQAFLEENITTIMAMGIATRGRALQVLEGTQNNLQESVNVLLALLTT